MENTIPILSRRNLSTVIYDTYLEAINAINSRTIHKGELFFIAYRSTMPNYDILSKKVDIILAYGIQENEYRILNFCTSNLIWGVVEEIPAMDSLIHDQQFLYHKKEDDTWYLVYSLDHISRRVQEIDPKPQTFIEIETGNLWVSSSDKKVRCINDVCSEEETRNIISNLTICQKDWNETDDTKPSYIRNKPDLSELGDLSYTIRKNTTTGQIDYNLYWTRQRDQGQSIVGTISIEENKVLVSGSLETVTIEDKGQDGKFVEYEDWNVGDRYLDLVLKGKDYSHVYIYMEPIIDSYHGTEEIEIKNNIVSVKVDTDSGLTSNISWNLATESSNGAMSFEDHNKLNNLDISLYAKKSQLESGEVEAKETKQSRKLVKNDNGEFIERKTEVRVLDGWSSDDDNSYIPTVFTQPFSTLQTTKYTYPTNEAILNKFSLSYDTTSYYGSSDENILTNQITIKTTGANQFNYLDESSQYDGFKLVNGVVTEDEDYTIVCIEGMKDIEIETNINFEEPIKNNGYLIFGDNIGEVAYSDNLWGPSISVNSVFSVLYPQKSIYGPNIYCYKGQRLLVSILKADIESLCIRLAWDLNSYEFEEYTEEIKNIQLPTNLITLGDYDTFYKDKLINIDGTLWIKKIISETPIANFNIDYDRDQQCLYIYDFDPSVLGINIDFLPVFRYFSTYYGMYCFFGHFSLPEYDSENNVLVFYIGDIGDDTVDSIKTGTLYSVLDKPTLIDTGINSSYTIPNKYGTTKIIPTLTLLDSGGVTISCIILDITSHYLVNQYEQLSNFRKDLNNTVSKSDIDIDINSTNPVQNKVAKGYIDRVMRDFDSAKDLSMYDIFGVPNRLGASTANCYVIYEEGTYMFPLTYGNFIKDNGPNYSAIEYSGEELPTPDFKILYQLQGSEYDIGSLPIFDAYDLSWANAEIIWSETENIIVNLKLVAGTIPIPSYESCAFIKFTVTQIPITGSNVIIGIKDVGSDTIIWSWHIWIVPNIDKLHPVEIKNRITDESDGRTSWKVMPMNLGFVYDSLNSNFGTNVFYQWGRKDPIPRTDSQGQEITLYGDYRFDIFDINNEDPNINTSVTNPNLFFPEFDSTYNNWHCEIDLYTIYEGEFLTAPYIYNLWNSLGTTGSNDNSIKTAYDPCPVGWKIPPRDVFRGFTTTSVNAVTSNQLNVIGEFSQGYTFKKYFGDETGIWFPATGYRDGTGSAVGVGTIGTVWSSSPNEDGPNCSSLVFKETECGPLYSSTRCCAYSCRPVLDE